MNHFLFLTIFRHFMCHSCHFAFMLSSVQSMLLHNKKSRNQLSFLSFLSLFFTHATPLIMLLMLLPLIFDWLLKKRGKMRKCQNWLCLWIACTKNNNDRSCQSLLLYFFCMVSQILLYGEFTVAWLAGLNT